MTFEVQVQTKLQQDMRTEQTKPTWPPHDRRHIQQFHRSPRVLMLTDSFIKHQHSMLSGKRIFRKQCWQDIYPEFN